MTSMILVVIGLALINFAYKAIGPAILGDHEFPGVVQRIVDALPAAMLAGLLVVHLLGDRWTSADVTVVPGLAAAVVAWYWRVPQLGCVVIAGVVTIVVRAAV